LSHSASFNSRGFGSLSGASFFCSVGRLRNPGAMRLRSCLTGACGRASLEKHAGFIGGVIGAIILLAIYGFFAGRQGRAA
jgi:hypothetical protein